MTGSCKALFNFGGKRIGPLLLVVANRKVAPTATTVSARFYSILWLLSCLSGSSGLKLPSTEKLILARLGVSRTIYVIVDSSNIGFPYFNFLGGYQSHKTPCI